MFNFSQQIQRYHDENVALGTEQRDEMRKRRNTNRARLEAGLKANGSPAVHEYIIQGSYAMWTMIQDDNNNYDIDDGAVFRKADLTNDQGNEMTPQEAKEMVCKALKDGRFKKPCEVRDHCVRVYYDEGYHIDVPVYRLIAATDGNGNDASYLEYASPDAWKPSDARKVTGWFKDAVKNKSPESDPGQFRDVVRLLKTYNKNNAISGRKAPSGFILSILAEECYSAQPNRLDLAVYNTMTNIKNRLQHNLVIKHPVTKEVIANGSLE
jgi:hypothetical protein